MTPTNAIQRALRRTFGTASPGSPQTDAARDYLNDIKDDIVQRTTWRWMFVNATISAVAATRAYDLASDVLRPVSFRDQTNNRPLTMRQSDYTDRADPDNNQSGTPSTVVVTGITASTGFWSVDIIPTPSANATIAYRYYAFIADITSSNDGTDFLTLWRMPPWIESALPHGVTMLYKQESNNSTWVEDQRMYERAINSAITTDSNIDGDMPTRLSRSDEGRSGPLTLMPTEGSLS
jgi:hypothetical protein